MNEKKIVKPAVGMGISSILLIFLIVCLSVFSVLALTSATSDYKMSKKIADHTTQYYKAYQLAQDEIAKTDEKLQEIYKSSKTKKEYLKKTSSIKTDFTVKINDTQAIEVKLEVNYPKKTGDVFYQLKSLKTISTTKWKGDDSINVYKK